MWYFFIDISKFSLIVIGVLFLFSIPIRGFWCRYLCPYGALLGITALLSPAKIKRNSLNCIDCNLCNKACPALIKVDKLKTVISDECTTCLNCVDICPVDDTLQLELVPIKWKINKRYVAVDNVCAWPQLRLSANGDIFMTGFNRPYHGLAEGDVDLLQTIANQIASRRK